MLEIAEVLKKEIIHVQIGVSLQKYDCDNYDTMSMDVELNIL